MIDERWCGDCGLKYNYDSNRPLGATTEKCPSCQKQHSRKKRRFDLLLIAGRGEIKCRACGFSKYPYAIKMMPGREYPISNPTEEARASESYLLCLNCEAALNSGDIKVQVINVNVCPIKVSIWDSKVSVVETNITQPYRDDGAVELEVVSGTEKEPEQLRNISRATPRVGGSSSE